MLIHNYGLQWSLKKDMTGVGTANIPVDFSRQLGVYILYQRRKIVYVGRSSIGEKAGIAGRLVDHIRSKESSWMTYSWFGFLPVDQNGQLVRENTISSNCSEAICDVEALLIRLLNPALNRNSGSHSHIEQYKQI